MSAGTSAPAAEFTWSVLSREPKVSAEWSHSGIAADADGTVYWAAPEGESIITHHTPTGRTERITVPLMEIHDITVDPGSAPRLWLADPGFKMRPPDYRPEGRKGRAGVFDLTARTFHELSCPPHPRYANDSWRPTSIAVDDTGALVVVADGYGASLMHLFVDGEHVLTIDSADDVPFMCPHGVVFRHGPDGAEVVIADRGNSRLVALDPSGRCIRTFTHPSLRSPSGLAWLDGRLLVTDLDGALLGIDLDLGRLEQLVPFPAATKQPGWPNHDSGGATQRPTLANDVLNSPHGVATGPDGSIFLTEWVIGGRELQLRGLG